MVIEPIPGVTYRVEAGAGRFFVPGQMVLLTQKGSERTSRDDYALTLWFRNLSTGQEVTLEGGHTVEGLVPVLPEGASTMPAEVRAWAVALVSGPGLDRVDAAAKLARLTEPWVLSLLWNQAFYDRALFLTSPLGEVSVQRTVHHIWAESNPAGVAFVEAGLSAGTIEAGPLARRFLAKAKSLFLFATLVTELASPDAQERRSALEEVETIGRDEFIPALRPLVNDENPSVAIKAAYVLKSLGQSRLEGMGR